MAPEGNCDGRYTCTYSTTGVGMKGGWYTAGYTIGLVGADYCLPSPNPSLGCITTMSQSAVYVPQVSEKGPPRVRMAAAGAGLTTKAVAVGLDPYAQAMSLTWDFGDDSGPVGGTFGAVVTHKYAAVGDYLVTARVQTTDGRTAATSKPAGVLPPKPRLLAFDTVPPPDNGVKAVAAGLLQGWPAGAGAILHTWTTGCPADPLSADAEATAGWSPGYVAVGADGSVNFAVTYLPDGVNAAVIEAKEYRIVGGRSVLLQRASDCVTTLGTTAKTTADTAINATEVPVDSASVPVGHVALVDSGDAAEWRLVTAHASLIVAALSKAHAAGAPVADLGLPVGPYKVPAPPANPSPPTPFATFALSVTRAGNGSGIVSAPVGIACGVACSKGVAPGAKVTLSAAAAPGSRFAGWSGSGCSGVSTCTVTMSAARAVKATFSLLPAPSVVSAGGAHSCARVVNGSVKCWGSNSSGQLGNATTTSSNAPVTASGIAGASSVAAGPNFTCALINAGASGRVRCWGANAYGQLGDGTKTRRTKASTVVAATGSTAALIGVGRIAVGSGFACAVLAPGAKGTVRCWGANAAGQLGDGTTTQRSVPVKVKVSATTQLSGVTAVAAGGSSACAVLTSGAVRCWGANTDGQLGDGTTTSRRMPVAVSGLSGTSGKVTMVSVGAAHACARLADGTVRCWGRNAAGQLGDGTATRRLSPVKVRVSSAAFLASATAVSAGGAHTCAVTGTGASARVRCWGSNVSGQLGTSTVASTRYAVATAGVVSNGALSVSCGSGHTVVLVRSSARPPALGAAWGLNTNGQLGNGATTGQRTPTIIPRL
jgi:alpha-tubulin suppressor-like RCC1 family protein